MGLKCMPCVTPQRNTMMQRVLVAACMLAVLVLVAAQKSTPPNVQGRWDDRVCHLIPNSRQLYQRRTFTYSAVNRETRGGTFDITTSVFNQPTCGVREEVYRTVVTGNFQLGSRSANLERFWKVDYAIGSQRMEVFSSLFGSQIEALAGCTFAETWVPNVPQDITNVNCPELNLISAEDCPLLFDIARRDESSLWLGASFTGHPPTFHSKCRKIDRPLDFDRFSLVLFGAEEEVEEEEEGTFELDEFIDPMFDAQMVISNDVETSVDSGATTVVASAGAIFAAFVAALLM